MAEVTRPIMWSGVYDWRHDWAMTDPPTTPANRATRTTTKNPNRHPSRVRGSSSPAPDERPDTHAGHEQPRRAGVHAHRADEEHDQEGLQRHLDEVGTGHERDDG